MNRGGMKPSLKLGLAVAVLVLVIAAGVIYHSEAWRSHSFLGDDANYWTAALRTAVLAVATVVGVVCGTAYKLPAKSSLVAETAVSRQFFSELVRPLLASPLVFTFVYTSAREVPDLVLAGLLAFENGFFCESILNRRPELKD